MRLHITNCRRRGPATEGEVRGVEYGSVCQPGKDGGVNSAPHVLMIDGTSDTEAVLKAVLEPRGTLVERARGSVVRQRAEELSTTRVVVIDMDDESSHTTAAYFGESHRVLIGSVKTSVNDGDRFLSKPFQYPELLRTIEDLLALPKAS